MTTMNISLPDALKAFVDERVARRGYGTSSAYVLELIRRDQDRLHLCALPVAGAASAPAGNVDGADFELLCSRVTKRRESRSR